MKIAYGSDLHLELKIPKPDMTAIQDVDILVLGGDIYKGRNNETGRPLLLEYAKECTEAINVPVVVICGNHELYDEEVYSYLEDCRIYSRALKNVHFLENDVLTIGDVRILGCTLWSDFGMAEDGGPAMELAQQIIYDYKRVEMLNEGGITKILSPSDTCRWNEISRHFLLENIAKPFSGATIVATHFPPVPMSAPEFSESPLTPYFNNDWTEDIQNGGLSPDVWISGHTHYMEEFTLGKTRIRSSQGGYPGELEAFKWGIVDV
jgi:DNA repair exonuclease SbcCD nuclease subunit